MTSGTASGLTSGTASGMLSSMDTTEKTRENRLRRMAERQGLKLERSRRRDPRASDYGTYRLVNPETNTIEAYGGYCDYGMTLDEIERSLTRES